jgi:hypothetical protein
MDRAMAEGEAALDALRQQATSKVRAKLRGQVNGGAV